MSYLKTKKVHIPSVGREVDLVELHCKAETEMFAAHKEGDSLRAAAVAVKYGWPEWHNAEVDEVMAALPRRVVQEVSEAVLDLSGGEAKNSESTPSGDSSSA